MSAPQTHASPGQSGSGGDITVTAPATLAVGAGQPDRVRGIRLSISGRPAKGETFSVTIMNNTGDIEASDAGGAVFSGARPTCLTITGTMAQVNAALATLTDQEPASGTDTLTTVATDSLGDSTPVLYTPMTIAGAPTIIAPTSETVKTGVATRLTGLSIAETDFARSETFTVTLTDSTGVFTETGGGAAGSGTNHLTLHGDLKLVDQDLKRVSLTDGAADTIVETVTDSFGNSGGPVDIAVKTTAPDCVARFVQAAAGRAGPVAALSAAPLHAAASVSHLALAVRGGHTAIA
jgi:hypothetical protein